ncbi:MAG: flagellar hook-basal body complex protein [Candidatus Zixiibacteriota bacterium]|nr:MAG: flagellar hook-basal body complex protein [candidate division Zixibacteria bacterium]
MMGSLFAGVSGLKNHQVKMNVIGNNIANVNTIGYKPGRVNFQEALVQTFKGAGRPSAVTGGTNPQQLGLGMQVAAIDNMFLQGGLETTGQITDLAIQGAGFFILADNNGNTFYTRAGGFGFDADSNLVDPSTGLFVQGKLADASGVIPSIAVIENITLPFGQQDPAKPTELVTLAKNINATATDSWPHLISSGTSGIDQVSGKAVDGVGGTHTITITGAQAVQSSFTGSNVGNDGTGGLIGNLGASMTLGDLGVTIFDDFGLSVDGGTEQRIDGLDSSTTVGDLVNFINQINGVTASLTGGEIQIVRDKAGAPSDYYFDSLAAVDGQLTTGAGGGATAGNILGVIFGVSGVGSRISSTGGAASTFVATDTFLPDRGYGAAAGPVMTTLDLIFNDTTGLVTGLDGLGGGGVILTSPNGISATAGDLIVQTDPTLWSTSINVFDSLGGKHTLMIEFFKSIVDNRWEWTTSLTGIEVITGGETGFVSFNSDGSLNSFEYFGGATAVTIDPRNGASIMRIAYDAGTIGEYDGLTQFASGRHDATFVQQDGYGLGVLENISIDQSGNISGIFSNGVSRILAQIMLADFTNQAGLRKAGRSFYQTSANSGDAIEGIAGATIAGEITSGTLESSAVDIAQEFTGMITAQRGFQANARIITTSDSMLDELVNLKR